MPGTRNSSVGLWGTVDPKIDSSQRWLAAPNHREARLIPEGIGVTREGWLASGWCGPNPETDSRPHGRCTPERAVLRSGQPRGSPSPGRGRWGETRRSSLLTDLRGIRQHHRSSGAGGSRPAPSGMNSGGNGCGLDNPRLCLSRHGPPGGGPALLQWPHEGTTISCAFSMLPEEHPIGFLRRPLPDIRPKTDGSPSRRSPEPEPV
jgi:hypothetical protein